MICMKEVVNDRGVAMRQNNWTSKIEFLWSDNWSILENEAWFVTGEQDILFCIDRKTRSTTFAKEIPERKNSFRLHPKCIKYGDTVFCLPDTGENIWCYHVSSDTWKKIVVDNPQKIRIACTNSWIIEDKLYIVSIGLKQILEVDISREIVTFYYDLPVKNGESISSSILIGQHIYVTGVSPVYIYKFDCLTKKIEVIQLFGLNDSIQTISYDGEKFWLSGRCRKIYIWKEDTNEIISLDSLPDELGIWNFSGKYDFLLNYHVDAVEMPLFLYSIFVNKYIWFIPAQSNEILYIDTKTYEIRIFHLKNEDQTEENVKTQLLGHKYLLEYVRSERYIGLFSLKNRWVIEIDTLELNYNILQFHVRVEHTHKIRKTILYDKFCLDNLSYEHEVMRMEELFEYIQLKVMDKRFMYENERMAVSVGEDIYARLK